MFFCIKLKLDCQFFRDYKIALFPLWANYICTACFAHWQFHTFNEEVLRVPQSLRRLNIVIVIPLRHVWCCYPV